MRSLAASERHETPTPPRTQLPRPASTRSRPPAWLFALALGLCIVIAVAAVIHGQTGSAPKATTPAATFIAPAADGMGCVQDVAWSPTGDRVAVLGYANQCRTPQKPGAAPDRSVALISIYNAATYTLIGQVRPDAYANQALPSSGTARAAPREPAYDLLLWSPDGNSLAAPFTFSTGQSIVRGVVLTDTAHQTTKSFGFQTALTGSDTPTLPVEWDMTHGQPLARDLALPPALAYSWRSGGTLTPSGVRLDSTQPIAAPALGPVGTTSAASFAIWQAGTVSIMLQPTTNGANSSVWTYREALASWSPDGRYLAAPMENFFMVAPATAPGEQGGAITLPTRDAALRTVFQSLMDSNEPTAQAGIPLAWRPDGTRLAARMGTTDATVAGLHAVTLLSCATGKPLAKLTPQSDLTLELSDMVGDSGGYLRWSPDGAHLLLLAPELGTITIWGPEQLPK